MPLLEFQDLWRAGDGGYHTYRIPALVTGPAGELLAFCEGRKHGRGDAGEIDLLLRRSVNHGRTWGPVTVVASRSGWTCGNPAPVLDRETGVIWLPFCQNLADGPEDLICQGKAPRTVWLTHSVDGGQTWAEPMEITGAVKLGHWSWYATGPGHALQLSSGRLLIPCDHVVLQGRSRQDPHHSHVIYSDDHGATWRIGGITAIGTNECTAVELPNGQLWLNSRNRAALPDGGNFRAVSLSPDGGLSFGELHHEPALPEPICQASALMVPGPDVAPVLLFSNPAERTARRQLTLRLSVDEGRSWAYNRVLHPGHAAYSDLAAAGDGSLLCLFETGEDHPYQALRLARCNLAWVMGAGA